MSEPRKVTRKEMLDVLERIEDETRDEIRVIKKGEWAETRLPLMEERIRAVASLRRLIEKQGEWQRRAQAMMCSEPPEYDGADLFDLVKEISDSDRRLIEEAGRKKIPNE